MDPLALEPVNHGPRDLASLSTSAGAGAENALKGATARGEGGGIGLTFDEHGFSLGYPGFMRFQDI